MKKSAKTAQNEPKKKRKKNMKNGVDLGGRPPLFGDKPSQRMQVRLPSETWDLIRKTYPNERTMSESLHRFLTEQLAI